MEMMLGCLFVFVRDEFVFLMKIMVVYVVYLIFRYDLIWCEVDFWVWVEVYGEFL